MFTVEIKEKSSRTAKPLRLLSFVMVAAVALILGAATPQVWAGDETCEVELDEAEVFFEYNFTDGDLGIQFFWDGEPWKRMIVKNKWGRAILDVIPQRQLRSLGLAEGFFESNEPELCDEEENPDGCSDEEIEEAIEEFQAPFPEGLYRFRGWTVEGCRLVGSARLSHDLPTEVAIISPEVEDEEGGDSLEDSENPFINPFIVEWTRSEEPPRVVGYEVVAEMVINGRTLVNTATLPRWVTRFTVSPQFIRLARNAFENETLEEFKVEVLAIGANRNKTITEVPVFELEDEE